MKILKVKTDKRAQGNEGEAAATKFLKKLGYKIIERNYVALGYEIDIIAESRDAIAFVEVKSKMTDSSSMLPRPASLVTPEKQRKIITAAKYYIGGHPTDKKINLDVIEVYFKKVDGKRAVENIIHMECAYNLNTARERR